MRGEAEVPASRPHPTALLFRSCFQDARRLPRARWHVQSPDAPFFPARPPACFGSFAPGKSGRLGFLGVGVLRVGLPSFGPLDPGPMPHAVLGLAQNSARHRAFSSLRGGGGDGGREPGVTPTPSPPGPGQDEAGDRFPTWGRLEGVLCIPSAASQHAFCWLWVSFSVTPSSEPSGRGGPLFIYFSEILGCCFGAGGEAGAGGNVEGYRGGGELVPFEHSGLQLALAPCARIMH